MPDSNSPTTPLGLGRLLCHDCLLSIGGTDHRSSTHSVSSWAVAISLRHDFSADVDSGEQNRRHGAPSVVLLRHQARKHLSERAGQRRPIIGELLREHAHLALHHAFLECVQPCSRVTFVCAPSRTGIRVKRVSAISCFMSGAALCAPANPP